MWVADPASLITVSVLIALYAFAAIAVGRTPAVKQLVAYGVGFLVLVGTVTGPIDELTRERSFFIYIFQQMLLVFVIPPLLLAGLPDWMLRPVMTGKWVEPVARRLTRPLFAFLLFSLVFTLVHYPALCDRVCHIHPVFGDVRTLLLLTGLLLWWPLLSPLPEYPRMSYPLQVMYLFLLMIPMTAVAAPITMANSVLYMFYMDGPHPFGLNPLSDQVLGGILMWVGQGAYIMFVFTAIFVRWARVEDEEMPPINRQPAAQLQLLRSHDRRLRA